MLEHLQGYQVFANEGRKVPLMTISRITDASGQPLFEQKPGRQDGQLQVISPAEAYLMTDTLKAYQNQWNLGWKQQMASKSGTSGATQLGVHQDAWMMAYNHDLVIGGWAGNTGANGGGRPEVAPRGRADTTGMSPPAAPARRAEAPSLSPAQAGGGRTGWLSELLTRASQEAEPLAREVPPREAPPRETPSRDAPSEGARPERHTIEALDSLAVDIARMIDHDAAAELWDRYNRGERNVFTRKLYTMQGQKAFEEIRRKYRSERDFQRTVDRYIGEFERLLEEVSRDDRGQAVARTYLTSETGKVYTMLAHAAGRFD